MNEDLMLMPFLDASESFTTGFECGQIWQRISEGETFENQLIHTSNVPQMEMICNAFGAVFEITKVDDTWSYLTIKTIQP